MSGLSEDGTRMKMNVDLLYQAWEYHLEKQRDSSAFQKLRWLAPYQAQESQRADTARST